MNPPNPGQPHHSDALEPDRGTPVNALWGLILVILTFLLVVVCVLSIDIFADVAGQNDPPDTPGEETPGEETPGTDTPGTDTPGTDTPGTDTPGTDTPGTETPDPGDETPSATSGYIVHKTTESVLLDESILFSDFAVLVDVEHREIVAGINYDLPIFPASMTKIMTLLVACEALSEEQLNDIVTIPADIVTQMQIEGASGVGLRVGEELTVTDLLYAIALGSDGVASATIARYVAGSEAAFVDMMNQKAEDLSLLGTHFCNPTGLHHPDHVTTCREMASIFMAALDHPLVNELLSTRTYTATTNVHPTGHTYESTYFVGVVDAMRRYGYQAQPAGGTVLSAKTGMTDEAKYCLATYYETTGEGKPYVVITAHAKSTFDYVKDYIILYEDYVR